MGGTHMLVLDTDSNPPMQCLTDTSSTLFNWHVSGKSLNAHGQRNLSRFPFPAGFESMAEETLCCLCMERVPNPMVQYNLLAWGSGTSLENCYSISKTLNHKHIMHIVKVMYKNTKCKIPCLKEHQNRKIGDILEIGKEECATNSDPQKSNVIGS